MSDRNTKPSRASGGQWRVLNHTDKLYSEITTRAMTDEEKSKYGKPTQTKIKLGDDKYMAKLNISTENLLEDCKEHGTDWAACKVIGEKRNLTQKQVSNLISLRGIKKLMEAEKIKIDNSLRGY